MIKTSAFPTEANPPVAKKHFIHLDDFSKEEINELLDIAISEKKHIAIRRPIVQTVRRENVLDDFCEAKFTNASFF